MRTFRTSAYALHNLETATGLKFVVTTDPSVGHLRDVLKKLYATIYVPTVVRNPLYKPGQPIECPRFAARVDSFFSGLPMFS